MLELKNISLSFKEKKILDNVSFSLQKGEIMLLGGKSGAGKSTILRIIANLIPIDSGELWFDGKLETQASLQENNRVGIVFQNFNLFNNLTVFDNIALAPLQVKKQEKVVLRKKINDLLSQYDLLDQVNKFPLELSGGQKQRVALIRTLILEPVIVLLDEPSSGLDSTLTEYIILVIMELKKENKIVIVTSHDSVLVEKLRSEASLVVLDKGKIISA
jgi:polar amino acid transport system ATP-binding protein